MFFFLTVLSGIRDNMFINTLYISVALPSINLPQPATNNVSPVKNVFFVNRSYEVYSK